MPRPRQNPRGLVGLGFGRGLGFQVRSLGFRVPPTSWTPAAAASACEQPWMQIMQSIPLIAQTIQVPLKCELHGPYS